MVEINDITKNYGDFHLNVSMEIPDGTIVGIVGRNGAGKSTTIKAILGLIKLDGGQVKVFDKDVALLEAADKQQFGITMAESGFSSYFKINDVYKILKKTYKNFDEEFFLAECKRQDLPLNKKISEFSTGMKAKLKVLVAISHKARFLILDEPTAGLDIIARNEVIDMLRGYMEKQPETSMLISSHISSDLEGLCDDIYMIHNGKVLLHEDTDSILGNYAVIKVSDAAYENLDKVYLLKTKKQDYGYICLTNEKKYYLENYPDIVIENGNIDDLIIMMTDEEM
ncbi:MAG: ABC transporter ATP-binding protein [Pseudobutyrivibrio sp.]|nr:ABC transporter ATP-binding protein [Pseudobutyrivibrio sp.]